MRSQHLIPVLVGDSNPQQMLDILYITVILREKVNILRNNILAQCYPEIGDPILVKNNHFSKNTPFTLKDT